FRDPESPMHSSRFGKIGSIFACATATGIERLIVGTVGRRNGLRNIFPRAGAGIDRIHVAQLAPGIQVKVSSLALRIRRGRASEVGSFGPSNSKPMQIFEHGLLIFGATPLPIQVLTAQDEASDRRTGSFEGYPECSGVPHMQVARGRGCESSAIGVVLGHSLIVPSGFVWLLRPFRLCFEAQHHIGGQRVVRIHRIFAIVLVFFSGTIFLTSARAQPIPENTYQELRWRMIGPFRGGRTRAVSGVPSQPNVFYVGAVNGGVWKSNDYGRTWNPIFDDQPTQSIGAIAVAPSDPNIVYVASGEGLHRPDLSVGNGIYKSIDAGKTWTHLGLQDGKQIPALAIDPHDPNRLFAAVLGRPYGPSEERGIYRSTDGGQNWQKVLSKDENTGGSDVEIDPSNPNVIYAGMWEVREGPWEDGNQIQGSGGGLFKSTDGGNTWRQLKGGLPDNVSQINVAIAASQPNRLYAALSTTDKVQYGSGAGLGFYRSDDGGETWSRP